MGNSETKPLLPIFVYLSLLHMSKSARAAYIRDYRKKRKDSGHCVQCNAPLVVEGAAKCERCRAMFRDEDRVRANMKWQARRDAGLCVGCSTPITEGVRCLDCKEKHNKHAVGVCRDLKAKAVKMFNNTCADCGFCSEFFAVYDFHHIDPSLKQYGIAELFSSKKNWELIVQELAKCIMLCSNCHRIRHSKENTDLD